MIVLMAGLPGCGKSTLAEALAARLSGIVLDKDKIRAALFGPTGIEYSTEQDDFCQELMLETAAWLFSKNPAQTIFLDGRPFSRRYQIEQIIEAAQALGQRWHILECICSAETARKRLEQLESAEKHPAANRSYALFLKVKETFEEIRLPKTVIDTQQPLESCVELAIHAISLAAAADGSHH